MTSFRVSRPPSTSYTTLIVSSESLFYFTISSIRSCHTPYLCAVFRFIRRSPGHRWYFRKAIIEKSLLDLSGVLVLRLNDEENCGGEGWLERSGQNLLWDYLKASKVEVRSQSLMDFLRSCEVWLTKLLLDNEGWKEWVALRYNPPLEFSPAITSNDAPILSQDLFLPITLLLRLLHLPSLSASANRNGKEFWISDFFAI
ncbi:hypothetical protein BT96DRAFT_1009510 [Gymnopus androsaceus JB14]|uniref:Uncharacterized protein n=1 Tax=Gymnopus androsaceus JB14 TaxID=1447944 RepID=A0A6A4GCS7_9AGAR|nr:hypothetical protein BT96DRAFT_1009510 [Gymnopus androsaceus JB14]